MNTILYPEILNFIKPIDDYITDGQGEEWEDISNAIDGDIDTYASVSIKASNFEERILFMAVDLTSIKGTITNMNLSLTAKQNSSNLARTITIIVDVNGDSSKRVMAEDINTNLQTFEADLTRYSNDIKTLKLIPSIVSSSSTVCYLHDIRLDITYEDSKGEEVSSSIYIGANQIIKIFYGSEPITNAYLGSKNLFGK